jgi:hypothetical protein
MDLSGSNPEKGNTRSVSADETYARWQEWIGTVRKEKISVGAVLDESRLVEVNNGMLRISCPDEYHTSTIKRYKEYLVDSFHKLTGHRVLIEPVCQSQNDVESIVVTPTTASSPPQKKSDSLSASRATNPILDILKRELGAEPVT